MTSTYAIRLYELLIQWGSVGEREIELTWLRQQFQLDDKYKAIKDFKKRVLEPAVSNINEHSDIEVQGVQRKTGRTVTHLKFTFAPKKDAKPKPSRGIPTEERIGGIPRDEIERLAKPGESWDQASARIARERGRKTGITPSLGEET